MKLLSVVVPVHNEEPMLKEVVENLLASRCPIDREWIFVDDGSTDGSLALLKTLQAQHGFHLIEQKPAQGKGAAITRGFQDAQGDVIIIQDADFEYDPNDIPFVIQPILDNKADVVYGSRFKKNAPQVRRTYHYFANSLLTLLSNLFSGIYFTDMETCYKAFRADLLKAMRLKSRRFGIEVEMTAYVAKTTARIYEVPISYFPRTHLEGKKINWKDGVAALIHLVRFNFFMPLSKAFHSLPPKYLQTHNPFRKRDPSSNA
jgi:glycosyltransferase involved in cell wall biosynthesis